MKFLVLILSTLLSTPASASEATSLTFSLRGMVGLSVRLDHPVSDNLVLLEEIGASGWLIYGDDPTRGGGQSPTLIRPHLKLGADWVFDSEGAGRWYAGPRLMGAVFVNPTVEDDLLGELALQGTVGRKWDWKGLRMQLGAGLGVHHLRRPNDELTVPLPHIEVRLGPVLGKRR